MHRDDDDQSQPHHGKAHYEIAHGSARQPPLVEDDGQPLSEDSGSQRLPHLRVLRVEQKQGGLWVPIGPSHSLGKAYFPRVSDNFSQMGTGGYRSRSFAGTCLS